MTAAPEKSAPKKRAAPAKSATKAVSSKKRAAQAKSATKAWSAAATTLLLCWLVLSTLICRMYLLVYLNLTSHIIHFLISPKA